MQHLHHPKQRLIRISSFFILLIFLLLTAFSAKAQYNVTGIYTDYNGYWESSSTTVSAVKPANSHNMLAFTWNGTTYSTGINNALLTTRGVSYSAKNFRAFPINSVSTGGASNYITLGQLYDGVNNGASVVAPFIAPANSTIAASFLTDGVKGLDLGTGLANIPAGPLRFNFSALGISASAINDGVPDIVVTQIAQPTAVLDKIYFVNALGGVVGNQISIDQTALPTVGNWTADFYNFNGAIGIANSDRTLKLWAADLTSFGLNAFNVGSAVALIYELAGTSDVAFVAFNEPSINIVSKLGMLLQPAATALPACCNNTGSSALTQQPIIQLLDALGNTISQSNITVTASIASGPSGYGALGGTTTVSTNVLGQANFTDLVLPCQPGTYTLTFTSSNLTAAVSSTITVGRKLYYPRSSGINNLSSLLSWSDLPNGLGLSPANFGSGKEFVLSNSANDANFTTGGNWTVLAQLTVPSGKTLNITTGTTTTLSCDISENGTITAASGSSVILNGSAAQTLGGINNIKNLTINNTAGVTLTGNVVVDNTLTLTAGTLNIGSNTLSVKGSIARTTGDINASNTSATVSFEGSSAQTITQGAFTGNIYNLIINNAADVTLGSNLSVSNTVTLSNGKLVLSDYALAAGSIAGSNSNRYIKKNGLGKLTLNIGSAASKLFAVGNSTYDPVTITNNTGLADNVSVRVLDEVYRDGLTGNALTMARIKTTWDMDKTLANGGSGMALSFEWGAPQNTGITTASVFAYNSAWAEQKTGTTTYPTATSVSYTGYMGSFRQFSVLQVNSTLPLVWQSFEVMVKEADAALHWQTATEQNTLDFTIQHSSNGTDWTNIGSVKAAGNSISTQDYYFTDANPSNGSNYYRLIQTDRDGKYSYSAVKKIYFSSNSTRLQILGNPVYNGTLGLSVNAPTDLTIYNTEGKPVWQGKKNKGTHYIDVHQLPEGVYILKSQHLTNKFVIARQ